MSEKHEKRNSERKTKNGGRPPAIHEINARKIRNPGPHKILEKRKIFVLNEKSTKKRKLLPDRQRKK